MIQQTSLMAFEELKCNPWKINRRCSQVYSVIKELGAASDLEIANKLNLPINCITPRRLELEERGLIEFFGQANSQLTGRLVRYYKIRGVEYEQNTESEYQFQSFKTTWLVILLSIVVSVKFILVLTSSIGI